MSHEERALRKIKARVKASHLKKSDPNMITIANKIDKTPSPATKAAMAFGRIAKTTNTTAAITLKAMPFGDSSYIKTASPSYSYYAYPVRHQLSILIYVDLDTT